VEDGQEGDRAAGFPAAAARSAAAGHPGVGEMPLATFTEADRARIMEAIRAAEADTAGEIYVVVAREADEFRLVPVLWAAIVALIVPWPLHLLTYWSAGTILLIQVLTFVVIALAASHPALRHRIVPASIAADAARKAAEAQFLAHGVHLTENRTGVLIFVALADRRVEIVADAGINRKVDQSAWDELARDVIVAARAGVLADGLVTAVQRAGVLLTRHCPPAPLDRNELPDRVVEI
jgi:putative membrane protein